MTPDLLMDIARELQFVERTKDIYESFCWPDGMTEEDKRLAVLDAKKIRICPASGLQCYCDVDIVLFCRRWAKEQEEPK